MAHRAIHPSAWQGGIYSITHLPTGREYIGQTRCFNIRWAIHRSDLRRRKHCNKKLENSWYAHGEQEFAFAIVEVIKDARYRTVREQFYMDSRQPYYNLCRTAVTTRNFRWSDESRMRLSLAQRARHERDRQANRPLSERQRAAYAARRNRQLNLLQWASITKAAQAYGDKVRGKPPTVEMMEKLRKAWAARAVSRVSRPLTEREMAQILAAGAASRAANARRKITGEWTEKQLASWRAKVGQPINERQRAGLALGHLTGGKVNGERQRGKPRPIETTAAIRAMAHQRGAETEQGVITALQSKGWYPQLPDMRLYTIARHIAPLAHRADLVAYRTLKRFLTEGRLQSAHTPTQLEQSTLLPDMEA